MSLTNTNIQLKRSKNTLNKLANIDLDFGEPLFVDNIENFADDGTLEDPVKAYLVLGRKARDGVPGEEVDVSKSPVLKALSQKNADNLVFYNSDDGSIVNEAGDQVPVNRVTVIEKKISELTEEDAGQYHILAQKEGDTLVYKFTDDLGIFINGRGITKGMAWNDYAETRPLIGEAEPGDIVCDVGGGFLQKSTEKYQACPHVVSDTYGQLIGEETDETIPIAVAGRVQVKVNNSSIKIGDCICAGANGVGEKMTRQEITNYPDRIVGVVCEIPRDDDSKVWINVK